MGSLAGDRTSETAADEAFDRARDLAAARKARDAEQLAAGQAMIEQRRADLAASPTAEPVSIGTVPLPGIACYEGKLDAEAREAERIKARDILRAAEDSRAAKAAEQLAEGAA